MSQSVLTANFGDAFFPLSWGYPILGVTLNAYSGEMERHSAITSTALVQETWVDESS